MVWLIYVYIGCQDHDQLDRENRCWLQSEIIERWLQFLKQNTQTQAINLVIGTVYLLFVEVRN